MSALTLDVRPDHVAVLTIDQPGRRANVLSADLLAELEAMIAGLATRTDLLGLVIASAKPGIFIAGADLNLFANAVGPHDPAVRAFLDQGNRTLFALEALPFPTCAAIDGAALGGGLEVALACRSRVTGTSPKVQMGLPETKLGLIPGWGGTQRLTRIVGRSKATVLLTTGKTLNAHEAEEAGLAHGPIESTQLLECAAQLVQASTTPPQDVPSALCTVLDLLASTSSLSLREGIALETEAFMYLVGTPESKRLIAEFFASRVK